MLLLVLCLALALGLATGGSLRGQQPSDEAEPHPLPRVPVTASRNLRQVQAGSGKTAPPKSSTATAKAAPALQSFNETSDGIILCALFSAKYFCEAKVPGWCASQPYQPCSQHWYGVKCNSIGGQQRVTSLTVNSQPFASRTLDSYFSASC